MQQFKLSYYAITFFLWDEVGIATFRNCVLARVTVVCSCPSGDGRKGRGRETVPQLDNAKLHIGLVIPVIQLQV